MNNQTSLSYMVQSLSQLNLTQLLNFSYNLFGIESTNLVFGYDLLEKILFFIYWRKIFLPEIQEKAHRHRVNLAYLINS